MFWSCINNLLSNCQGGNTWSTLTHWGRDKMAAIFQTTFSNAFSWMKMYEFRLRFHWSLFLRFQLTISHHWFWFDQATSHYLNQGWKVYWCIYASLSLNELKQGMVLIDLIHIFQGFFSNTGQFSRNNTHKKQCTRKLYIYVIKYIIQIRPSANH